MSKIDTEEKYAQVATISAENEELGKLIASTIAEIGVDGPVSIEESQKLGIEKEIVKVFNMTKDMYHHIW